MNGYTVKFVPSVNVLHSADLLVDGTVYEMKSPTSNKIEAVERNLKRATHQSRNIIFDSSRMKRLHDERILSNVIYQAGKQSIIKKVIFVGKRGKITFLTF